MVTKTKQEEEVEEDKRIMRSVYTGERHRARVLLHAQALNERPQGGQGEAQVQGQGGQVPPAPDGQAVGGGSHPVEAVQGTRARRPPWARDKNSKQ